MKKIILTILLCTVTVTNAQFFTQNTIDTSDSANSVFAIDLDSDGDYDILAASEIDNQITWYENEGGAIFSAKKIIEANAIAAKCVFAIDLDGDLNPDILSASAGDNTIAWYKNLGNGTFGSKQILNNNVSGANYVSAADLDNDGDIDVLSSSYSDAKVAWYENNGSGVFSSEKIVTSFNGNPSQVTANDLDGDNDLDLLITDANEGDITWIENLGNGTFGAEHILGSIFYLTTTHAADIDGDNDLDIIASGLYNAISTPLQIYINQGSGIFVKQPFDREGGHAAIKTADVDGDNDLDIIASNRGGITHEIIWIENIGSGNFGSSQLISTNIFNPESIFTIDLDIDGDVDVLSASANDNKISWFENSPTTLSIEDTAIEKATFIYPNPTVNQIKVKADESLLGSSYSLYNLNGKLTLKGTIISKNTIIDVSNLTEGTYLLALGDNLKQTFKVLKK